MRVPSVAVEPCDILSYRDGRPPVQQCMGPMRFVEVLEGHQFVFQVRRRPKQQLIHAFSSQRADQPLDKRMRQRHIRQASSAYLQESGVWLNTSLATSIEPQ